MIWGVAGSNSLGGLLFLSQYLIWRSLTSHGSIRLNFKYELSELDLHQKVAKEIILNPNDLAEMGVVLSLKITIFLYNHTFHKIAPLNNSTRSLSFKGIEASSNHKSSKELHVKVNELYVAIQFQIKLTYEQCINKWSVLSCWSQNAQVRSPGHPFFAKLTLVRILSRRTSQRKFLIFKGM